MSEKKELLAREITKSWRRNYFYYTPITIDKKYIVGNNSGADNPSKEDT